MKWIILNHRAVPFGAALAVFGRENMGYLPV